MRTEFCKHLESYGMIYSRAEATYNNCVHLLETYLDQLEDASLAGSLAQSFKEWLAETGMLRHRFKMLVDDGAIEMVRNPDAERSFQGGRFPLCRECAFPVPRLDFEDFQFDDEGELLFREKPLPWPPQAAEEADARPASRVAT